MTDNETAVFRDHLAHEELRHRIAGALAIAEAYGSIDGAHHKAWVIDKMVRVLTGPGYEEWVRVAKDGAEAPETHAWDEGVAP